MCCSYRSGFNQNSYSTPMNLECCEEKGENKRGDKTGTNDTESNRLPGENTVCEDEDPA